jgi:hypothetical protein
MLSKKDKEWIAETIAASIKQALTVNVKMERRRDLKTGQPLAVPVVEVRDVYLPIFWVEYMPYHEQALRILQDGVGKVANNDAKNTEVVKLMAEILMRLEGNILRFSEGVGLLIDVPNDSQKRIENKIF